ncbi:MAG: YgiT-type zinc finger protein [Oscillospiraceae bacterium]|nr:YgiT-type zinc finger protein [Oscillospiraceae bacterium]
MVIIMKCISCGANTFSSTTTDVTDLGNCLIIVRNVPCYKCSECDEIIYTGDVIKQLENITETSKKAMSEIAVVDYNGVA